MRHDGGMEKSPPSACNSPRSTEKSVDLPAPFAPTRPVFSPGLSVKLVSVFEKRLGAAGQAELVEADHAEMAAKRARRTRKALF
ncbi:MAG: hypothetical protein CBHOC_2243 [uncultured Caballeronia sp.]|nr:MAG: hypothetical protein CBHOC_2243 [uncultured Caballeronia sp.]